MARLEFDLRSGAALFNSKLQVRIYAVEVRDGSLPRGLPYAATRRMIDVRTVANGGIPV